MIVIGFVAFIQILKRFVYLLVEPTQCRDFLVERDVVRSVIGFFLQQWTLVSKNDFSAKICVQTAFVYQALTAIAREHKEVRSRAIPCRVESVCSPTQPIDCCKFRNCVYKRFWLNELLEYVEVALSVLFVFKSLELFYGFANKRLKNEVIKQLIFCLKFGLL